MRRKKTNSTMRFYAATLSLCLAFSTLCSCGAGKTGEKYHDPVNDVHLIDQGQTVLVDHGTPFVVQGDYYVISGEKLKELIEMGVDFKMYSRPHTIED